MTSYITKVGTALLMGISIFVIPTNSSSAAQPEISPGLQHLLVLERRNQQSSGLVFGVDADYVGNSRVGIYQSNIQGRGIREGRNNRKNIFQRFFERRN